MRNIDADAMREEVLYGYANEGIYTANDILDLIDAQPTVSVSPWHRVEEGQTNTQTCGYMTSVGTIM